MWISFELRQDHLEKTWAALLWHYNKFDKSTQEIREMISVRSLRSQLCVSTHGLPQLKCQPFIWTDSTREDWLSLLSQPFCLKRSQFFENPGTCSTLGVPATQASRIWNSCLRGSSKILKLGGTRASEVRSFEMIMYTPVSVSNYSSVVLSRT